MSYYVSTRDEQRQARNPTNYRRENLPADEWRSLGRAQRRSDLESHFGHSGDTSRSYQPRRTAYQVAGLSRDRRFDISEVQNATRAALGTSFDPYDDDSYARSSHRDADYGRSRGWTSEAPRSSGIPRNYRDEYNQRFREDDDADQYAADYTSKAPWRNHARLDSRDHYRGEPSTHSYRPRTAVPARRADSVEPGEYDATHWRPNQASRFSWDDSSVYDSVYEQPKRRGFFDLFRH